MWFFFWPCYYSSSKLGSEWHLGEVNTVCWDFCLWSLGRRDINERIPCVAWWVSGWRYNLRWKKPPGVQKIPEDASAGLHALVHYWGHHVAPLRSPGNMKVAARVMHGQLLVPTKPLQISLQLMLFESGYKSFLFSYWERVFQDPDNGRPGILSLGDCVRHVADEAGGLWHCCVMLPWDVGIGGHLVWSQPPDISTSFCPQRQTEASVVLNEEPDPTPASVSQTWQYWGPVPVGHSAAGCIEIQVSRQEMEEKSSHIPMRY